MPRRDGYPTNQEMLTDFTTASRDLFADLYNYDHGDNLSPNLEEKPLVFLRAQVGKNYFPRNHLATSVKKEELHIMPIQDESLSIIDHGLQGRKLTPDALTLSHYAAIARNLGKVALRPGLNLQDTIPSNGVLASYTASFPGARYQNVETFSHRLNKQTLVAANYFVEEARSYLKTNDPCLSIEERVKNARDRGDDGVIFHVVSLEMTPDLPLSGREGTAFLTRYRDTMYAGYCSAKDRLDSGRHPYAQDFVRELAAKYMAALMHAQSILDSR